MVEEAKANLENLHCLNELALSWSEFTARLLKIFDTSAKANRPKTDQEKMVKQTQGSVL